MKKVLLTSMILLSTVSYGGNVYAQETSGDAPAATTPTTAKASVTFTPSVDGKTLTISGQGDLTSYMTTDFSARVFTDKAVGFVFADAAGNTPVVVGESYNAGKTYYQAEYNYTEVWKTEPVAWSTDYFGQVTSKKEWKEDKIVNLYKGYYSSWNSSVFIEAKVDAKTQISTDALNNDSYKDKSIYFLCEDANLLRQYVSVDELEDKGVTLVSLDELNDYITSDVTYQVKVGSLFVSKDGGQTYTGLISGVDYKWTPGDVFYQGEATYAQIENNDAFFGEKGTHSDFLKADERTLSFNDLLLRKITEGAYENVEFVNEGSDKLLIDANTIQSILFPNGGMNNVIKELDLGQATLNNLSANDFGRTSDLATCPSLETLTLPLTNKTIVKSETTQTDVSKMVVPLGIIPKGYTYTGNNLTTIHIPEGYERVGNGAFTGNAKITAVTFPKTLEVIGDNAFQNCAALRTIVFNEGLQNIGKQAFAGNSLTSVTFPSTLLMIDDGAFETSDQVNRFSIKLNAGLRYIGNSAFALGAYMNEKVLEIPASVRYIGPFAFNFRQYQDVYFYGEKAPLMPYGEAKYDPDWKSGTAFSEHTLDGNTGFDPSATKREGADDCSEGYANRENYFNGNSYFCILHYPKELDETKRATYTDITRVYKTDPSMLVPNPEDRKFHKDDIDSSWDGSEGADIVGKETGESPTFGQATVVGKRVNWGYQDTYLGAQYVWPSQAQFTRAYATASNGLCWNGVDTYRPELSDEDIATLKYAGFVLSSDGGEYSMDELQKIAHLGTRQFVLANADVNVDKEEEKEPEYPISMEGGKWWTICVPFNMTKKQVDETFGVDTHVCRFNDVHRLQDKVGNHYLKLYFQQDVYVHKSTKDANGKYTTYTGVPVGDDDIVIYAHESYMIRPTLDNKDANKMYNIKNYKLEVGSPIPTVIVANAGWDKVESDMQPMEDDEETIADRTYRFVGNYQTSVASSQSTSGQDSGVATQAVKTVTIPQFSFIYAKKKNYPNYQFWFYYGTKMAWAPNKCVVQASARDGGVRDAELFYNLTQDANGNWIPNTSLSAKKVSEQSFFGASDETTGINNVVIIAGDGEDSEIVYNLNGQVINNNGNLDGLQKGVYIKNGKKYMVK